MLSAVSARAERRDRPGEPPGPRAGSTLAANAVAGPGAAGAALRAAVGVGALGRATAGQGAVCDRVHLRHALVAQVRPAPKLRTIVAELVIQLCPCVIVECPWLLKHAGPQAAPNTTARTPLFVAV